MIDLIFIIALGLAFAVAFAAGANDEMMAPGVAARAFSLRSAVIIGAIISVFGATFLGDAVAETLGEDLILEGFVLDDIMIVFFIDVKEERNETHYYCYYIKHSCNFICTSFSKV